MGDMPNPDDVRAAPLNKALSAYTITDWKNYLLKNLVTAFGSCLSKPFDQENFRFYGTVLSGSQQQLPRWKRLIDNENDLMGELLGQLW